MKLSFKLNNRPNILEKDITSKQSSHQKPFLIIYVMPVIEMHLLKIKARVNIESALLSKI